MQAPPCPLPFSTLSGAPSDGPRERGPPLPTPGILPYLERPDLT